MKSRTLALFCCYLLWAAATPTIVAAGEAVPEGRIVVRGAGAVEAEPDIALLHLRIVATRPTTQQAMSEVGKMVVRVVSVAADLGIEAARIATQSLTLAPHYENRTIDGQRQRKRIGFRASQGLQIEVRKTQNLAPLIDRLSDSEILQVSGLRFAFAKPEELLREARRRALKNARARAGVYAEEAGVEVGRVISIVEDPRPGIAPRPMLARASVGANVPPGERRLVAEVTVTYAIRYRGDQRAN